MDIESEASYLILSRRRGLFSIWFEDIESFSSKFSCDHNILKLKKNNIGNNVINFFFKI